MADSLMIRETRPVVLCPWCGKHNPLANEDGYTEEFPREWHAHCAMAAAESGKDPREAR